MTNGAVNIRFARDEDSQRVLDLLNSVFTDNQRSLFERGDDYWQWKFRSNVFGESIVTIAECDDEIIGVDHLWPWEFISRGIKIKACQPCDSAVKSSFRGKGIFQKMRLKGIEKAKRDGRQFLFNFPNENSLSPNLKVGSQFLGQIAWWVKIFKPLELAQSYFKNELSLAAKMDENFKLDSSKLDEIANSYKVFDKFLTTSRIGGFHEWRYLNRSGNRQYGMYCLEVGHKKIAAVFTLNQNGKCLEMVLVDILGNPQLTGKLLEKIVNVANSLGVGFLALMNNECFQTRKLWKRGFIKKKMKNMVVLPLDMTIENKVTNIENWSLVAGIHDSI